MGRFNVLKSQRETAPAAATEAGKATRRGNPAYRQFSAYLPVELHKKLKVFLAEKEDMDLSEAVEQAVKDWLEHQAGPRR